MIGSRLVWVHDPINKRQNQGKSLAFIYEGGLDLANRHPTPIIYGNHG